LPPSIFLPQEITMTKAELRQKAVQAAERMKKFRDDHNERKKVGKTGAELWGEEHDTEWRALNAEYDGLQNQLADAEREEDLETRANAAAEWLNKSQRDGRQKPGLDDSADSDTGTTYGDLGLENRDQAAAFRRGEVDRRLAFQAWAGRGLSGLPVGDAHRDACQRLNFDPHCNQLNLRLCATEEIQAIQRRLRMVHPEMRDRAIVEILETRALSAFIGGQGAYLVAPASMVRSIEVAMISYGAILQAAETITTENGEEMGWPVGDDTANEGEYVDENQDLQANGEPNPAFEACTWKSFDISSKFVKIPFSLVRDSFANIEVVTGSMLGERLGRKLSGECTNGTHKIRGLIPRAAAGKTAAGAAAIVYADVVGLEHSIDPAIRDGSQFMFHDLILQVLRLIVDSQNRPLWASNIREGVPDTFNGRRFVINQKMDSTVASGKKTMAFGRLENYKVRRVGPSLRTKRLVERFAEKDQLGLVSLLSADGNLLRPKQAAACPVKYLIQP